MRRAILLLLLVLCSCCPKHYPQIVYRDSIRVEIRERLVHDTVKVEVPKIVERNVTKDTTSHLENDWAQSDAAVSGGLLWHSLETKPHTIYVPVEIPVHDTTYIEKEAQETIVEKEVEKPLTWWQKVRLRSFWILFVSLAGLLVWTFRKPLMKLLKIV